MSFRTVKCKLPNDPIFLDFPRSDGDKKKWPANMKPLPDDADKSLKWRMDVGAYIGEKFLGKGEVDAKRCVMRSWPEGYGIFVKERKSGMTHRDFYLYGGPHSFRSPGEFEKHAIWLMREDWKSIEPTWIAELRRKRGSRRQRSAAPTARIRVQSKANPTPSSRGPRGPTVKPTPPAKQIALKNRVALHSTIKVQRKSAQAASSDRGGGGGKGVQPAAPTVASKKITPSQSPFARARELVWYLLTNPIQLPDSDATIRLWPALVQHIKTEAHTRTKYTIRLLATSMVLYTVEEASLLPYMAHEVDPEIKALIKARVPRHWWTADIEDEGVDVLNAAEEDIDAVLAAYALAAEAAIQIRYSWTVTGAFDAPADSDAAAALQFKGVWWGPEHIRVGDLVRLNFKRENLPQLLPGTFMVDEEDATYKQAVFLKVAALFPKTADRRRALIVAGAVYALVPTKHSQMQPEMLPKPPKGFKFTTLLPADEQVELPIPFVAGRYYPRIQEHPGAQAAASAASRALEGLLPGPERAVAATKYVFDPDYKRVEAVEVAEKDAREGISKSVLRLDDVGDGMEVD
ncbi:Actin-related protein 8 [Mycena kentingensis (nom. inval.)]|nr:Actin-related protein 8 [Mycena kentingensis (nom. inval.)]